MPGINQWIYTRGCMETLGISEKNMNWSSTKLTYMLYNPTVACLVLWTFGGKKAHTCWFEMCCDGDQKGTQLFLNSANWDDTWAPCLHKTVWSFRANHNDWSSCIVSCLSSTLNTEIRQKLKAARTLKNMAFIFYFLETGGMSSIIVCLGTQDLMNKNYLSFSHAKTKFQPSKLT